MEKKSQGTMREQMGSSKQAKDAQQEWKVTPHPFGGGYCAWYKDATGRVRHMLGIDGCSARTFVDRGAARAAIAAAQGAAK